MALDHEHFRKHPKERARPEFNPALAALVPAAAKKMPGVLGVFTGEDCVTDKLGPIPHDPLPKTKFDMKAKTTQNHSSQISLTPRH